MIIVLNHPTNANSFAKESLEVLSFVLVLAFSGVLVSMPWLQTWQLYLSLAILWGTAAEPVPLLWRGCGVWCVPTKERHNNYQSKYQHCAKGRGWRYCLLSLTHKGYQLPNFTNQAQVKYLAWCLNNPPTATLPTTYQKGNVVFTNWFLVRASAWLNTWSCLPVRLSVCPPVPVSFWRGFVDNITSTIVGEYRRVFYNYPGPKNEQCHTQTV